MKKLLLLVCIFTGCAAADPLDQGMSRVRFCYKHVSGNEVCATTYRLCEEAQSRIEHEEDIKMYCRALYR